MGRHCCPTISPATLFERNRHDQIRDAVGVGSIDGCFGRGFGRLSAGRRLSERLLRVTQLCDSCLWPTDLLGPSLLRTDLLVFRRTHTGSGHAGLWFAIAASDARVSPRSANLRTSALAAQSALSTHRIAPETLDQKLVLPADLAARSNCGPQNGYWGTGLLDGLSVGGAGAPPSECPQARSSLL